MYRLPHYLEMLRHLMPPGQLDLSDTSNFGKLLKVIAQEFVNVEKRLERLREEADPRTTSELLPEYEFCAGLPDECAPDVNDTFQQRRSRLVKKLTGKGGQSRPYFLTYADDLGYDVRIEEYRPMAFGSFAFGIHEASDDYGVYLIGPHAPGVYPFYSNVRVDGPRVTRFSFGLSAFGEGLAKIDEAEDLECILGKLQPAHINLNFIYEEA